MVATSISFVFDIPHTVQYIYNTILVFTFLAVWWWRVMAMIGHLGRYLLNKNPVLQEKKAPWVAYKQKYWVSITRKLCEWCNSYPKSDILLVTYLPVLVRQIMAAQFCENEASTAAIAVVVVVDVGVGVRSRSSLYITRWNMAASASKQILFIIFTASTGYLPSRDTTIDNLFLLFLSMEIFYAKLKVLYRPVCFCSFTAWCGHVHTCTFGCLPWQHDTVSAIQHSISHVARLSSSGAWFLYHTFQHLKKGWSEHNT